MVGDPPDFVQLRLGVDRPPRAVWMHTSATEVAAKIFTPKS